MTASRFTKSLELLIASLLTGPIALIGTAVAASHAPLPGFSVQDLVRLQRISEPAVSPAEDQVAYTLRTTDIEANKGRTSLWVLSTGKHAGPTRRLTDPVVDGHSAEWSADGKRLYFLATHGGSTQVWRVNASGDQEEQVTHLTLDVGSFRLSPRGDALVVSLEVFTDCADLPCTQRRLEAKSKQAATGQLYDRVFVRHWDTWSDSRRSQLYWLPLKLGDGASAGPGAATAPVRLTAGIDGDVPSKPFGGREDYSFSPDGQKVAFSVRIAGTTEPWSTNFDIYEVATSGGTPRNLTADNPAWDGQPSYSPDGSQLAYVAMERPGFESDRFHLVLLDTKSGTKHSLTQNWDRSIANFGWSRDGSTLFATTDHLGQHPLWAIDAKTGRASAITGAGQVEGYSVGSNKIYYTLNNLANPADLYSVGFAGGKATQHTRLNQAALEKLQMGEYEQFSFEGWNHENVFGYVVKPANFKRNQQYPVAVLVHGGPQGSMANEWHYRWNPQNFSGAGYGSVMIDFHGSTGYGQAFTDSISKDWGGKPLEDIKLGVAAALKQFPWLDGGRMCALGGSYGGFMMNWIAVQSPDAFKCLVSHAGIFDQRSMYYSTEELWFNEWENGGTEFQNPAAYAKYNPVDHIDRWKTPTLVIHGQLDYRVPYTQGLGLFTALQRRGIPSEFLYFPDENHWILKPANSVQWYEKALAWMDTWTKAP